MPPKSSPSITKQKVDLHLRDINDIISEEDINNIDITPAPRYQSINEIKEKPVKGKAAFDKKIPVSWNIL